MLARSFARREREALCDLALEVGPDAPTLREGTVAEMVVRLLVVERQFSGNVGPHPPAALATSAYEARLREYAHGFEEMVERLRRPSVLARLVPVLRRLPMMKLVLAHEDIRRAQPDADIVRQTSGDEDDLLWRKVKAVARRELGRYDELPLVLLRSDPPRSSRTINRGADPVTIKGKPLELVLFVHRRHRLYNVSIRGPRPKVQLLEGMGYFAGGWRR